jgi:hypothetical protein
LSLEWSQRSLWIRIDSQALPASAFFMAFYFYSDSFVLMALDLRFNFILAFHKNLRDQHLERVLSFSREPHSLGRLFFKLIVE